MKKLLILASAMLGSAQAQVYIDLSLHQSVYDVEVVVFARHLAQPLAASISQAEEIDTTSARPMLPLSEAEDWPLFRWPEPINPESEEWQVPIDESPSASDALAWYLLANQPKHDLLDRLQNNPSWEPLIYQQWRQPATPFLTPDYVLISTLPLPVIETEEPASTVVGMTHSEPIVLEETEVVHPDYTVNGMLAFSKQQFIHFHVKMNLLRHDPEGNTIRYAINQKKRIKLDEWQYIDHQQFGVLARVNKVDIPEITTETNPDTQPIEDSP